MVGPHHYRRRDRSFPADDRERLSARLEHAEPDRIAGTPVVRADSLDGRRYTLAGNEWLLVRFSGTERAAYVREAGSPEKVEALLDAAEGLLDL